MLREKYPNIDINPNVFKPGVYINGGTVCFFDDFTKLDQNLSYCNTRGLVTFTKNQDVNRDNINKLIDEQSVISSKIDIVSIKYLWDIFDLLDKSLSPFAEKIICSEYTL